MSDRPHQQGQRRNRVRNVLFTPGLSRHPHGQKEVSVAQGQLMALQNLFETHPTLVAASAVLEARLLSGGLTLRRDGTPIDVQPAFREHLDTHWTRFARDLLRQFLVAGFAVASYEKEPRDCATNRYRRTRRKGKQATLKRIAEQTFGELTVPYVAPFPTYRLTWEQVGKAGYVREYRVYRVGIDAQFDPDPDVVLYIATPPDEYGNVNSPMAAVHNFSHFVDGLVEQAALAEPTRAQPALVTQVRSKEHRDGVSSQDMFFDSESRGISREQQEQDNAFNARALQLQLLQCRILNENMGATSGTGPARVGPSAGTPGSSQQHETVTGRLFTLPHVRFRQ